jgi:SAM-dependent methyltransferase
VAAEEFTGKRLLDFGDGSGTSTVHLARIFPQSEIVWVVLLPELLEPAQGLMEDMGFEHVRFVQAKAEDSLPDDLGSFDFVTLNAVYEHLLPNERRLLLPQLWASLRRGGVLFLNMTLFRWYRYEHHTTELWFVNYLPDWLALRCVRFFGGRKRRYLDREGEWEGRRADSDRRRSIPSNGPPTSRLCACRATSRSTTQLSAAARGPMLSEAVPVGSGSDRRVYPLGGPLPVEVTPTRSYTSSTGAP